MALPRSFSWEVLKKNRGLISLLTIIGTGGTCSVLYLMRLAIKSPDVTWSRVKNPEPWQEYENKTYKLYSTNMPKKYVTFEERPKF